MPKQLFYWHLRKSMIVLFTMKSSIIFNVVKDSKLFMLTNKAIHTDTCLFLFQSLK